MVSDRRGRGGGGRDSVGASATDDASMSRLVKQLFGALIRRRVSRHLLFGVSRREKSQLVSSFDEKCEKSVNYTLKMQYMYISVIEVQNYYNLRNLYSKFQNCNCDIKIMT